MRTRPLGTELSETEAATVARFDAAPDAEESLRERVAIAIHNADDMGGGTLVRWEDEITVNRDEYRALADAAIAVLRGEA